MKKLTVWMAALLLLTACGAQNAAEPAGAVSASAETEAMDTAPVEISVPEETEMPAGAPETAPVESEMRPPVESTPEESEPEKTETAEGSEQSPVLVIYFSRVGNTDFPADVDAVSSASLVLHNGAVKGNAQLLAEWMADEAGCETWEITTAGKYPVDYDETTDVAKAEQNENTRPELLSEIDGFAGIEQIYLIYPN